MQLPQGWELALLLLLLLQLPRYREEWVYVSSDVRGWTGRDSAIDVRPRTGKEEAGEGAHPVNTQQSPLHWKKGQQHSANWGEEEEEEEDTHIFPNRKNENSGKKERRTRSSRMHVGWPFPFAPAYSRTRLTLKPRDHENGEFYKAQECRATDFYAIK